MKDFMNMASDELIKRTLNGETISIELPPVVWFGILANLQLAMRHPSNAGPSSKLVMDAAMTIQNAIAPDSSSPLWLACAMGWDPSFDDVLDEARKTKLQ